MNIAFFIVQLILPSRNIVKSVKPQGTVNLLPFWLNVSIVEVQNLRFERVVDGTVCFNEVCAPFFNSNGAYRVCSYGYLEAQFAINYTSISNIFRKARKLRRIRIPTFNTKTLFKERLFQKV